MMFLVVLLFYACKKETVSPQTLHPGSETSQRKDSVKIETAKINKSIQRTRVRDTIFLRVDAAELPLSFVDSFTNDKQELHIQLDKYENKKISVNILPRDPEMNIRVSQIFLPDGTADGPFGRNLNGYTVGRAGPLRLRINKSMMVSSNPKGVFRINIFP